MTEKREHNKRIIWLLVLVLFICVAATTFTLMNRLNLFMPDDSGAVELTGSDVIEQEDGDNDGDSQAPATEYNFKAYDDEKVWTTDTTVDIFTIAYRNGEQEVSVKSSNGDNVIAPGTDGSYIFKFRNTGEAALDYTVTVDAYCEPEGVYIPVESRLSRYDGEWIAGDEDEYVDVKAFNRAEDTDTLGAGRYTYYTLDWQWLFEQGRDEADTMLGNLAGEEELVYTIEIKTVASPSADPDNNGGILIPQTGDTGNAVLWMILAVSLIIMIVLLFWRRDKEDETEA